jgi:hypothetical protein
MEVFERGTVVMSVRYNESLQQEQNKHLHLGSLANWLHAKSLEFNYAVLWFKRQKWVSEQTANFQFPARFVC